MIFLVYGGSGSGKSEFAENLCTEIAGTKGRTSGCSKFYIATMKARDSESLERIERHKKQRAGKGFFTIEKEMNLAELAGSDRKEFSSSTALLECMSNLLANEMFSSAEDKDESFYREKILADIRILAVVFKNLVIVSGNVFEDGREYDRLTKKYMRLLAAVNAELAVSADSVYELVAGIPVKIK